MNNWKKEVDGHIIEYRYGSTGSIDPWSLDFADKNNIGLIVTADVSYYYLVDNNDVYIEIGYINRPDPYDMNSFDDINEYLIKYTKYIGKLQDNIEKLKAYIK